MDILFNWYKCCISPFFHGQISYCDFRRIVVFLKIIGINEGILLNFMVLISHVFYHWYEKKYVEKKVLALKHNVVLQRLCYFHRLDANLRNTITMKKRWYAVSNQSFSVYIVCRFLWHFFNHSKFMPF